LSAENAGSAISPSLPRILGRTSDGPPVLALTRIRFRSPITLLPAWFRFRQLYRARNITGLIRGTVSIVDVRTIVNVSIWRSRWEMLIWSGCDEHVAAVHWTYRRVAEVWSADWKLAHQSESAQHWSGGLRLGRRDDPRLEREAASPAKACQPRQRGTEPDPSL
jgi:hypothetical protein